MSRTERIGMLISTMNDVCAYGTAVVIEPIG
jgi:hypothetical protein